MPGTSLLTLLDDIASVLDDVAILSKLAAKKTAGVLGDDLALNAQQVTGVKPVREIPVVWAVAKGSFKNKAILVPAALAISAWLPVLITPLMMIGGTYLVYEGAEKLAHRFLHSRSEDKAHHDELLQAVADEDVDLVAFERDKIKGAVRTDFILSAEIIVLSLGVVDGQPFLQQALVLGAIALAMTVGVYGLVAGIVKLDDAAALHQVHAVPAVAHWLEDAVPHGGGGAMLLALANGLVGLLVGAVVVAIAAAIQRARAASRTAA